MEASSTIVLANQTPDRKFANNSNYQIKKNQYGSEFIPIVYDPSNKADSHWRGDQFI